MTGQRWYSSKEDQQQYKWHGKVPPKLQQGRGAHYARYAVSACVRRTAAARARWCAELGGCSAISV